MLAEIRDLARAHADRAIETIAELMQHARSESARLAAAVAMLDRAYGRPTTPLAGDEHELAGLSIDELHQRGLEAYERAKDEARPASE